VIKIAVLSDIHGNADALSSALEGVSNESVDHTVILGDLLTYGCQPNEVVDMLIDYRCKHDCTFIAGNHECFYSAAIQKNYTDYQPAGFVSESIEWTKAQIADLDLNEVFQWRGEFEVEGCFFSHANPYLDGRWENVESASQCRGAARVLRKNGFHTGIFGHTHRAFVKIVSEESVSDIAISNSCLSALSRDQVRVINPGSVGQARGSGLTYLLLEVEEGEMISHTFTSIESDTDKAVDAIDATSMSSDTKSKLIKYVRN